MVSYDSTTDSRRKNTSSIRNLHHNHGKPMCSLIKFIIYHNVLVFEMLYITINLNPLKTGVTIVLKIV